MSCSSCVPTTAASTADSWGCPAGSRRPEEWTCGRRRSAKRRRRSGSTHRPPRSSGSSLTSTRARPGGAFIRLARIPADTSWLQQTEIVGVLTPSVRALADRTARRMLPFSSCASPSPCSSTGSTSTATCSGDSRSGSSTTSFLGCSQASGRSTRTCPGTSGRRTVPVELLPRVDAPEHSSPRGSTLAKTPSNLPQGHSRVPGVTLPGLPSRMGHRSRRFVVFTKRTRRNPRPKACHSERPYSIVGRKVASPRSGGTP